MARIRTIKPSFFRHEELFEAEQVSGLPLRVAFAGLWTACDREGRFRWSARQLKLDCLPYDDVDFAAVLDALSSRGFIKKYACDGKEYGHIPSWGTHQAINNREAASELPPPPTHVDDASSTRGAREPDTAQAEGKGREREQEISRVDLKANGKTGFDAEFENDFWPAWRKNRVGDIAAKREFKAARAAGIPLKEIVDGARRYQASKPEWQNWKAPANWLKDGNWADEPSKPDEKTETPASEPREWVNTKDPRWPQLNYPTITTNQHPGEEGNYVRVSDLRGLMPPVPDALKRTRPAA